MQKSSTLKATKRRLLVERLMNELGRAASLEEIVERLSAEASFLSVLGESNKRKLNKIIMETGEHYRILVGSFRGLKKLSDHYTKGYLKSPFFKIGGETESGALESHLRAEKSMLVGFENILKLIDQLKDVKEVSSKGAIVNVEKAKDVIGELLTSEKKHVRIVEVMLRKFEDTREKILFEAES